MPSISVAVAHHLGQEEAVRRLKEKAGAVKNSYATQVRDAEDRWEGNTLTFGFSAMGFRIAGTVAVEPAEVRVTAQLPMLALAFKGAIERRIRGELEELLLA
jgi:putative polyhydroxyalkanoate system protein